MRGYHHYRLGGDWRISETWDVLDGLTHDELQLGDKVWQEKGTVRLLDEIEGRSNCGDRFFLCAGGGVFQARHEETYKVSRKVRDDSHAT